MKSTEIWDDVEAGPSDVWRPNVSPDGGRVTPPFKPSSPTPISPSGPVLESKRHSNEDPGNPTNDDDYFNLKLEDMSSESQMVDDADAESQPDMREYERRMKDVFVESDTPQSGFSPAASTGSLKMAARANGERDYDAEYKDIVGERAGNESELLEFPQRVSAHFLHEPF